MANKTLSQLIAGSLAVHIGLAFALLLLWPKKDEPAVPQIVPVTFVARSPHKEPEPVVQNSQSARVTHGKTAAKPWEAKTKAPAPKTRNGLLRSDKDAPSANADLGVRGSEFFAGAGEWKMAKPELSKSDKHETPAWKAEVNPNGSVKLSDKFVIGVPDVSDVIMRLRGETLYDPEKREYLKETKEARQVQSHEYNNANLQRALNELGSRLTQVWQNSELTPEQKKQRLFDIWDECAEEGANSVLTMSQMVRRSIQSFVSRNLPKGSELGYSQEELQRLNQSRSSKEEFNPYS